ncbi:DUF1343 domain-containing protein [Flavobacterium sp. '19STA2R22 D10 B1']|uniref:exo-beta-N-acetylmuramidase NamZ family protein n=1 Tax=Flavobacterium aerium TaxID=3037261 RepID=UPI00278C765C|nr:DUF1343 domain-containing protein [Flavobacterium sp. '19STA2R22 D10 B1']
MVSISVFKNTFLFSVLFAISCGNAQKVKNTAIQSNPETSNTATISAEKILTGADNASQYLPLLKGKKVGVVTNPTSIVEYSANGKATQMHLVDYLLENKVNVTSIYAPEHGFRGIADAGELIKNGKDTKTGLPIISMYGNNKKPKADQLTGIDIMVFDLQDVGARFYTYISSLHYVMEACAENNIPVLVLDRPNPNGNIIDGPVLEKENTSFVGMHPIPMLHGMTIGEYAQMINGEKWLKNGIQCKLQVIPCSNYKRDMPYSLPVKPSPNLPNDQSINLYASLCLFEGTNVSMGRGTDLQFQIYGSPYLPKSDFSFTPKPNVGAKDPTYNGKVCYGEDLSQSKRLHQLELKWLLHAYKTTSDPSKFFNNYFLKLAGTSKLQQQIVSGMSEDDIRATWKTGLTDFKKMRKPYLLYAE